MIKFSFVLPCYNVAPYVGRCIESIEAQDVPQAEYEILCVDDCSKDDTAQTIEGYQKKYPNIVLHRHTVNKTAGGARNTGIELAQGKYIWFVDPDDAVMPNILGKLYAAAEVTKAEMLFFNYQTYKESGELDESNKREATKDVVSGVELLKQCAPRGLYKFTNIYSCVIRKDFVDVNKIYYPVIRAGQDVVFIWSAIIAAQRCAMIEDFGYKYIRRSSSVTGSKGRFAARAIISQSLLFAYEIHRLVGKQVDLDSTIVADIHQAMRYAMNVDSRNIIYASREEQKKFYLSLQQNAVMIDELLAYMNRKTKNIFAYTNPYMIWQMKLWTYRVVDMLKKRNSTLAYE